MTWNTVSAPRSLGNLWGSKNQNGPKSWIRLREHFPPVLFHVSPSRVIKPQARAPRRQQTLTKQRVDTPPTNACSDSILRVSLFSLLACSHLQNTPFYPRTTYCVHTPLTSDPRRRYCVRLPLRSFVPRLTSTPSGLRGSHGDMLPRDTTHRGRLSSPTNPTVRNNFPPCLPFRLRRGRFISISYPAPPSAQTEQFYGTAHGRPSGRNASIITRNPSGQKKIKRETKPSGMATRKKHTYMKQPISMSSSSLSDTPHAHQSRHPRALRTKSYLRGQHTRTVAFHG